MRVTVLAHTSMVSSGVRIGNLKNHSPETQQNAPSLAQPAKQDAPTAQTTRAHGLPLIRETLNTRNISKEAKDIIMASWRTGTSKQYQVYLERWSQFCQSRGIDYTAASIDNGIDFLATLFASGLGYSAINTARSALSSVLALPDNTTFGSHPLVTRFLNGVFELKPSLPRYSSIWDVGIVLTHLRGLGIASTLDLKTLTRKTTMLLCLLTGQRCQTLTKLDITLMQILQGKIVFTIGEKLKTTRPGKHLEPIELLEYPQDESLCVVSHLKQYIKCTDQLRAAQHTRLLISHSKPHKPVTNSTVGKWAKSVLREAGIDTSTFSGNSARPASTSYGARSGLTLKEILKAGGWSNALTFAKHYHKPIQGNFGASILAHFENSVP